MRKLNLFLLGSGLLIVLLIITGKSKVNIKEHYDMTFVFGKKGDGPSEFREPIGIAFDEAGFMYISDAGNNRIQKFTADGNFVLSWGKPGNNAGEFKRPMHMTFGHDNNLYVADYGNARIQIFKPDGTYIRSINIAHQEKSPHHKASMHHVSTPTGVAVDTEGNVYVVDFHLNHIQKFNTQGELIQTIGKAGRIWGGSFHYPTDVKISSSGELYVADAYNRRIQKLTLQGRFLKTFGGFMGMGLPISLYGFFNVANGIALDSQENVYVSDFLNNRIQKLSSDGTIVAVFGEGIINHSTAVALDKNQDVWVVDFGNDRIVKFKNKTKK